LPTAQATNTDLLHLHINTVQIIMGHTIDSLYTEGSNTCFIIYASSLIKIILENTILNSVKVIKNKFWK